MYKIWVKPKCTHKLRSYNAYSALEIEIWHRNRDWNSYRICKMQTVSRFFKLEYLPQIHLILICVYVVFDVEILLTIRRTYHQNSYICNWMYPTNVFCMCEYTNQYFCYLNYTIPVWQYKNCYVHVAVIILQQ